MTEQTAESVERVLREELTRGDIMLATARPILRHLLVADDQALFSDEVVARIRGMMLDVAGQLLFAQAEAVDAQDRAGYVADRQEALALELFDDTSFLAHAHAIILEAQWTERLHMRSGIDPVLPPLVQEYAAAMDPATAALAMSVLAAQARFMQHHRRMELPLTELPGDLFHKALVLLRSFSKAEGEQAATAERLLRESYDEGAGRLGLLSRLVIGMGSQAVRALAINHAGLAVFATALSMATGQDRGISVLSFAENQFVRLALSLRAAGLRPQAVEEQFLYLHPEAALPDGFEMLRSDRAGALLAASQPEAAL